MFDQVIQERGVEFHRQRQRWQRKRPHGILRRWQQRVRRQRWSNNRPQRRLEDKRWQVRIRPIRSRRAAELRRRRRWRSRWRQQRRRRQRPLRQRRSRHGRLQCRSRRIPLLGGPHSHGSRTHCDTDQTVLINFFCSLKLSSRIFVHKKNYKNVGPPFRANK